MSSSDNRHGRLKDRNKLYSSSGVFIVPFTTDDFFFFLGLRSLFLQHRFHRQVPFPLLLVFQQRAKLTIVSSSCPRLLSLSKTKALTRNLETNSALTITTRVSTLHKIRQTKGSLPPSAWLPCVQTPVGRSLQILYQGKIDYNNG